MQNHYDPLDTKAAYEVPTYDGDSKTWTTTYFYTKTEYKEFVESCFKEPGEYAFDEATLIFNSEARSFNKKELYTAAPYMSRDYINYWDTQKERCRKGAIVKSGDKTWYLTRDYYMWINFLPIFHKDKGQFKFPDIYDGQYHTALYEYIGEINGKHAVILKKRQYAMSYFHMAKLINQIWFEEGVTLKLLGYLESYINEEGSWAFLNEYRDFLNGKTAWYRPFNPDSMGKWQQRIQTTVNGRNVYKGLKGRLLTVTTQQNATKGVGGAAKYIVAEESGINPTLDKTYGYSKAALQAGPLQTIGQFIAYGSVGDLKNCDPLREFMYRPEENGFFGVPTKFFNDSGVVRVCGLFIPECWNMYPYSDIYGNSDVEGAIIALKELREQQKKDLSPAAYQLEISQHPLTIEEAFATREESPFPPHLIQAQLYRIEDKIYPEAYVDLYRDETGKVTSKPSMRLPISEFPLSKAASSLEKEGVIVVYEKPDPDLVPFVSYYASIDPVHTGKTKTSRSLCTIFIYKNPVEVTKEIDDTFETFIEGDKIVAEWTGRFDDIEKVHERCELLLEWYMAWCLIEFNGSFHTYMTGKKKTHFLVPSNQMIFNKEIASSYSPLHPYGWKNTGTIFKTKILPYGIEYCTEELDSEELSNGNRLVTRWGIERVQGSKMLLKEMQQYHEGVNVDRLVAYCALVAFAKIQQASRSMSKRVVRKKVLAPSKDLYKLKYSPFSNLGKSPKDNSNNIRRSPFKNLR